MATTSTDPRDIEADLERERAALASTLDTLSDRVSVDNLAKEALGMIRSRAGAGTAALDHAVRANPVAAALIGAGIAWMFLGPRITGSSSQGSSSGYRDAGYRSSAYAGDLRHDDAGWAASGAASSEYGRVGYVPSDNDEDHAWSREAHGLRARAMDALRRIEAEAKSYYSSMRSGVSSGASGARDFAAERTAVISNFTRDLRDRLSLGLDSLPPESRERILAARERAYQAMLRAERVGRDVVRDPGRAVEEHPLAAGAVAFALGAAVGAALPSTEMENRTFGAERDRLMDEAARMLREERGRARQLAGSLGEEVKAAARETAEAVADTVRDKASQAASRVGDRANEEFRNIQSGQGGTGSGTRGPGDPVIG
jgi:vacuolar-type H+-ATPase subunit H